MSVITFFRGMIAKAAQWRQPKTRADAGSMRRSSWIRGDYTLQNSELIFSAVTRIANAFASMPVQLYKGSTRINNRINDMLRYAPNPNMTSTNFFKTLEACRDTSGNAYAMKVYNPNGTLERLDVLDPTRVEPLMEKESKELWYCIRPEQGQEIYLHNWYILHIPFVSTNGYTGVNPVSVLLNTLDYQNNIQTFSADQLKNGVNAAIVLTAPTNLGPQQREDTIKDFMETYKSTSGSILLLESGLQAESLKMSPVDSNVFDVEKISRSRVAMVYNIPPHLMGDYSDASFASQEQQMLEFLSLTMLPIVTAYEQELDRKLLTPFQRKNGYHFEFDMQAVLRADAATMADVNYKAIRSGWKTVDEIRYGYKMEPLPNGIGSVALVSQDMAPLEYTVNTKPKVLASKLTANPLPEQEIT